MSDLELHELFDNSFDCYTYYEDDYMEEVKEPAMTKATFVAEVFKLLQKQANDVRTGDRQLTIPDVSNRTLTPKPTRYRCLLCGRDKFTRKSPHNCTGGFRKRNIKWQPIFA